MARLSTARIVGVIFTHADLRRAVRMRNPPDLFELRLDALFPQDEKGFTAVGNLRAPLIITARHPHEGGSNQLSAHQRRRLLLRFLPRAAYVDIELRSARSFAEIMKTAREKNIGIIVSCHDFNETPSGPRLAEIAGDARSLGADLLKIVTRTDTPAQLARLLAFYRRERPKMKMAAMGVGKLGPAVRRELFREGTVLTYVHLGHRGIAGQPSLREVRRWKREALALIAAEGKVRRADRVPARRVVHRERATARRR